VLADRHPRCSLYADVAGDGQAERSRFRRENARIWGRDVLCISDERAPAIARDGDMDMLVCVPASFCGANASGI
jgi:hypothetical protein